jgi:ADP-L-glycero-D-manno-heptose 6-epimerase
MNKYVVVTGAYGFIGSNLAQRLSRENIAPLMLVDDFTRSAREPYLCNIEAERMSRDEFPEWLAENGNEVDFIFHLGARTDTTEFNFRVLDSLNTSYTKVLWEQCVAKGIPFLYASSAATYGDGSMGFNDKHELIPDLKPLNPYGLSKQLFDMHVLEQTTFPPFWAGLKFFNVYGPNETHKQRMASVIFHAYNQIRATGSTTLFKSHRDDFKDGEQLRDFVYVDNVVDVCLFFYNSRKASGIYNLGSGEARTFNDLVKGIFHTLDLPEQISYKDIPQDIRGRYQYYTQAEMGKLQTAGYARAFTSLEEGVDLYVNILEAERADQELTS